MIMALLLSLTIATAVFVFAMALVTPYRAALEARRESQLRRLAQGGNSGKREAAPPELRLQPRPALLVWLARISPRLELARVGRQGQKRLTLIGFLLFAAVFFGINLRFDVSLWLSLALSAVTSLLLLSAYLHHRRNKRQEQIAESITEFLDLVVRTLRVGMPVSIALAQAGQELEGPLQEELAATNERISFGQDLSTALYELAERAQNPDLRFFAATVSIQMVTGGNLAEILEQLAKITRERRQLHRKITAITAEAKWSGRFLSGFPIAAVAVISFANPTYFDSLHAAEMFGTIAAIVIGLIIVNIAFMRWLSQID